MDDDSATILQCLAAQIYRLLAEIKPTTYHELSCMQSLADICIEILSDKINDL